MKVQLDMPPDPGVRMQVSLRRALIAAGEVVLQASNAQAPREDEPRHGIHMTDTAIVAAQIGPDGEDGVVIGYGAFWAPWQHEHLDWHHEHGHAKFLELAVVETEAVVLEMLTAAIAEGFVT